jgi:thymidylate synthase (FAD)
MFVDLEWITPEADKRIAWMARVSNAKASPDDPGEKLIAYLMSHKHWSPFEMASMCVKIETTRDIGRQILRHRSFHFQEFSQRYAEVSDDIVFSQVRLQDTKNRQNSIIVDDTDLQEEWNFAQQWVFNTAYEAYKSSLEKGIAKEVARKLLPEGLTPSTLYMSGTIRDWIHYLVARCDPSTQLEHREVALGIRAILFEECPLTMLAAKEAGLLNA